MSAEWVTAIATAGTFLVIAASALAALMQLRHMRSSNQIVALTECRETLESPEFREAQRFVSYDLPKRLADPQERMRAVAPQSAFEGDYKAIDTVANFFESMGSFVKAGIIDEHLSAELWSIVVLRNWNALAPVVTYLREDLGEPSLWENFEYLAWLSERHLANSHHSAHVARMPEDRSLLDSMKGARDVG
jgi:hypothetical protein